MKKFFNGKKKKGESGESGDEPWDEEKGLSNFVMVDDYMPANSTGASGIYAPPPMPSELDKKDSESSESFINRISSYGKNSSTKASSTSGSIKLDPVLSPTSTTEEGSQAPTDTSSARDKPKIFQGISDVETTTTKSYGMTDIEPTFESYSTAGAVEVMKEKDSKWSPLVLHWKYAAEEGSLALRVPALVGAVALIATSILPIVLDQVQGRINVTDYIVAANVFIMAVLILFLDGRLCCLNPRGCRAKVRFMITKNISFLRNVWGRGLLYIAAGVLQLSHMMTITIISGGFMVLVGVFAVAIGCYASKKLTTLRNSMDDDVYLLEQFQRYDSDKDGFLNISDFASFLASIGLEFDDLFAKRSFVMIDTESSGKISLSQFRVWWKENGYTL